MHDETQFQRVYAERFREEYRDIAPIAERFAVALKDQLAELLRNNAVVLGVPLEARVKSLGSIEEKLTAIHFRGASLTELHDLIGVRAILLFKRDLDKACDLIRKTFRVLHDRDKGEELGDRQFGYHSVHFLVRLPEQWLGLPTFSAFGDFQAEIQVRTLAQHIWAAASHVLQYKNESGVPPPLRRSINRASALLEAADLEFQRVLERRDAYGQSISSDHSPRPLNVDLLAAILDDLLPRQNKRGFEAYSLLLWELEALGIQSSDTLRDLIRRHLPAVLEQEAAIVQRGKEYRAARPDAGNAPGKDVFFSHAGLMRMVLEQEFGRGYYSKIWDTRIDGRPKKAR